ncbi:MULTISPECIES: hypothetical protein [unclassified Serratia (in: enterobacteria)]|uniref:hypothetical protein n=1 Tax=unclassified Serratia (in: enterobacteria) TaxID=2647522 RepID=UPI00307610E7
MLDSCFENRISDYLLSKMSISSDSTGFTDRNVREAIRILEGLGPVAPSSSAMRHKERQFKGSLGNYWHVHIPESHLARAYNNLGSDKSNINANPSPSETVAKGTHHALVSFAKSRAIPYAGLSVEQIRDNIINYANRNRISESIIKHELSELIKSIINKPFNKPNSSTGDWLLFWKNDQGIRFYLDVSRHIAADDTVAQEQLKEHLDALRAILVAPI